MTEVAPALRLRSAFQQICYPAQGLAQSFAVLYAAKGKPYAVFRSVMPDKEVFPLCHKYSCLPGGIGKAYPCPAFGQGEPAEEAGIAGGKGPAVEDMPGYVVPHGGLFTFRAEHRVGSAVQYPLARQFRPLRLWLLSEPASSRPPARYSEEACA